MYEAGAINSVYSCHPRRGRSRRVRAGNQTHQFSAVIKDINNDQNRARVSVRNRFEMGDKMEAFSPSETIEFKIKEITSLNGEPLAMAHGGGNDVFINVPKALGEFTLIRKPLTV